MPPEGDDEDWPEYPPAAHPVREALTMGCFALMLVAAVVWFVWYWIL